MGVRREFRKVALLTQEMVSDTIFFLFFIPGSLGAKDAGNVLLLRIFRYFDAAGTTLVVLRQFQSWPGVDEACSAWLSSMGGRRQFRKVAHTAQAMVPDTFFFS